MNITTFEEWQAFRAQVVAEYEEAKRLALSTYNRKMKEAAEAYGDYKKAVGSLKARNRDHRRAQKLQAKHLAAVARLKSDLSIPRQECADLQSLLRCEGLEPKYALHLQGRLQKAELQRDKLEAELSALIATEEVL